VAVYAFEIAADQITLNDDLLATVLTRRRRVPQMHRFGPPIRVIFGARDRYLNPRVARTSRPCSRTASCTCSTAPGTTSRSTSRSKWQTSSPATKQQPPATARGPRPAEQSRPRRPQQYPGSRPALTDRT
jgi:hypothetical protein